MGCTNSKVDDLPAVALCRERCHHLEQAIVQRYALAESHRAYTHNLKQIGSSLHRFFDQDPDNAPSSPSSSSPFLNLPPHKKGDPLPSASPAPVLPISSSPPHHHSHSHSHSGSHLHFHSDSDDDDDDEDDEDDGSLHHSENSTPLHYQNYQHHDDTLNSMTGGFMNMNFMQNRSTQSVVHEQRPMSSETVHVGAGSSHPSYNYPNYENHNPNPYPYYNNPPPYSNYGSYGMGMGMGSPPYGSAYPPPQGTAGASTSSSKPPPPPPSPPRTSAWDFLNPFETFDKYYPQNTSSRDSKSVREEEGIPDLEDESYQDEVVKEVHGHQKFNDGGGNYKKKGVGEEEIGKGGETPYEVKTPSRSDQKDGVNYQVPLVDKNVVANEERSEEKSNLPTYKVKLGSLGVSVIIREIKSQFDRASESGNEISTILEVGRVPFHRKNAVYQVSSKMLHSITPSLSVVSSHPSTSKSAETSTTVGSVYSDMEENVGMRSGNLLSTLQKLYIWEKKLYDEVKAEEKMRIVHERKLRRLKRLDERGAESQKIDSTRTLVRTLSTKIRIAIQVVDKISVKINKLRDEELWPQMNELIKGLIRMWKVMLECHRTQCQAIAEAKNLDAITSNRKFSGDHIEATMQLERVLLSWMSSFSCWVSAQKGYVKALNSWLLKCLLYEPEETVDGTVPFSPGRIGAPPVFVICNQWSQAIDRISEKEVIDAMRNFTMSVRQLSERHGMEIRQRMLTSKDIDRKVKHLEREEQKIQKEWQTTDKKMTLVSGQGIGFPVHGEIAHQSDSPNSSLHLGLKQIFEAMERFTASSMQVYDGLQLRCEEDRCMRESDKVS